MKPGTALAITLLRQLNCRDVNLLGKNTHSINRASIYCSIIMTYAAKTRVGAIKTKEM
jgi:hypothetical protein